MRTSTVAAFRWCPCQADCDWTDRTSGPCERACSTFWPAATSRDPWCCRSRDSLSMSGGRRSDAQRNGKRKPGSSERSGHSRASAGDNSLFLAICRCCRTDYSGSSEWLRGEMEGKLKRNVFQHTLSADSDCWSRWWEVVWWTTSYVSFELGTVNFELWTMSYRIGAMEFWATNYELWTRSCEVRGMANELEAVRGMNQRTISYGVWTTNHKLQTTRYELQNGNHKLGTTSYWLLAMS